MLEYFVSISTGGVMMNYKIIIWILFIVGAVLLIWPNPDPKGMRVTHLNSSIDYGELKRGDVIFNIAGVPAEEALAKKYQNIVKLETSRGPVYLRANGTLGIKAEQVRKTNLNFGLDLKGGTRAIIEPLNMTNQTLQDVISTLQTRINVYGLREANFRPVWHDDKGFIEITMAGGDEEELRALLEKQGMFEAKIPLMVDTLVLDETYDIIFDVGVIRTESSDAQEKQVSPREGAKQNETNYTETVASRNDTMSRANKIIVNGKTVSAGDSFELDNIYFVLRNVADGKANLTATVFTSEDIEIVYFDPQRSYIQRQGDGFRWAFGVQIGPEGARRFAHITQNLDRQFDKTVGESYLSSKIYLYLDGNLIDALNIAASLKGMEETNPQITGGSSTYEQALKTKQYLQTVLRSGSLPTEIEISEMNVVSPRLGSEFVKNMLYAGIGAIIALSLVVFIRYRKIIIIVPMLVVSMTELLIVLGMSVLIGWTIDLAAIAGLIAAIGTGVDDQLIILDRVIRKEEMTLRQRIKRAFFVVFGAAGTLTAAMLPLMIIGFGLLRGFAITTIVGVLVGVFITRPAFAVMVEKIVRED
jgi:preprotein translocase subunit SecD